MFIEGICINARFTYTIYCEKGNYHPFIDGLRGIAILAILTEASKRAGCKTIMVKTGQGLEELKAKHVECDYIADDLYDTVEYILSFLIKRRIYHIISDG